MVAEGNVPGNVRGGCPTSAAGSVPSVRWSGLSRESAVKM